MSSTVAAKKDRRINVWNNSQAILDAQYLMLPHGVLGFFRRLSKENILSADYGLIFLLILEHKHDENNPFPSQELLAKKAGLHPRKIAEAIGQLVACGLIRKVKREGKGIEYDIQPFIYKFERFLEQYTRENNYNVDVKALFTEEELNAVEELKEKKRKQKGKNHAEKAPVQIQPKQPEAEQQPEPQQEPKQEPKEKRQPEQPGQEQPKWTEEQLLKAEKIKSLFPKQIQAIIDRHEINDPAVLDYIYQLFKEHGVVITFYRFEEILEDCLFRKPNNFIKYFTKAILNERAEADTEFFGKYADQLPAYPVDQDEPGPEEPTQNESATDEVPSSQINGVYQVSEDQELNEYIAHHFYDSNRVATMDFERKAYWRNFMHYMEQRNAKDEGLTFLHWFLEDRIDELMTKNMSEKEICEYLKKNYALTIGIDLEQFVSDYIQKWQTA